MFKTNLNIVISITNTEEQPIGTNKRLSSLPLRSLSCLEQSSFLSLFSSSVEFNKIFHSISSEWIISHTWANVPIFRVVINECAAQSMADGLGLAAITTTPGLDVDVHAVVLFGGDNRLQHNSSRINTNHERWEPNYWDYKPWEIVHKIFSIDSNFAGSRPHIHHCACSLSSSNAISSTSWISPRDSRQGQRRQRPDAMLNRQGFKLSNERKEMQKMSFVPVPWNALWILGDAQFRRS